MGDRDSPGGRQSDHPEGHRADVLGYGFRAEAVGNGDRAVEASIRSLPTSSSRIASCRARPGTSCARKSRATRRPIRARGPPHGTFEPFDKPRAEQAGADSVVTKPFDSQGLATLVRDLVAKARAVREEAEAAAAAAALATGPSGHSGPPARSRAAPDDDPLGRGAGRGGPDPSDVRRGHGSHPGDAGPRPARIVPSSI